MIRDLSTEERGQLSKQLNVYGYAQVSQCLSPDTVRNVLELAEKHYSSTQGVEYRGVPLRDKNDKILYNLQNKDKYFVDLISGGFIADICKEKLNDPYYRFLPETEGNYILSYYNARSSGQPLDLHIDAYIPAPGDRTWAMQVMFVLEDMGKENGCTVVVPGSHQSGKYTDRGLAATVPITAHAGDVVIWDSRLWHGTLANTSGRSRWALIATFTSWWVKQTMDITRSLPDEIYKRLTNQQKAILGFCSIPPKNEEERINTKTGYESLKPSVGDYYV